MRKKSVEVIRDCTVKGVKRKVGEIIHRLDAQTADKLADRGYVQTHRPGAKKPTAAAKGEKAS